METVVVTNDDGISAAGIRILARHLEARGFRVCIYAPARPMSGTGKGFRLPAPVYEADIGVGECAYAVDATPAAAVYLALETLEEPPLAVVSGVNRGPNMGFEDILTSGTVGAALEAAFQGVPGVAVSLACDSPGELEYHAPSTIAVAAVEALASVGGGSMVVNVNSPPRPKGVEATVPAWNNYDIPVRLARGLAAPGPHGIGSRYWDRRPGTDVEAVLAGYASVSGILLDGRGLTWLDPGHPLLESIASKPLQASYL